MRYLVTIFFSALMVFTLAGCGQSADEFSSPLRDRLRGYNLADTTYLTLNGTPTSLQALHNGKPVVLNYWATWCPPCVMELPSLLRLEQQGAFQVITVSFDGNALDVRRFLKDNNLTGLTVLFDRGGALTSPKLGVNGLPTTLILDQTLTVHGVEEGGRAWDHAATTAKIYTDLRNPAERKN